MAIEKWISLLFGVAAVGHAAMSVYFALEGTWLCLLPAFYCAVFGVGAWVFRKLEV